MYIGQRRGNASTWDFSEQKPFVIWSMRPTILPVLQQGMTALACLKQICWKWHRATSSCATHGWVTAEEAIELAKRTEAAAFAVDKCITNSEGASVHAQQAHFVAANSRGFMWGGRISRHTISVAPIAGRDSKMQRDDWYSSQRNAKKLAEPEAIGRYTAERAFANARFCLKHRWLQVCSVLWCRPILVVPCTASSRSCWILWGRKFSHPTYKWWKT